MNEGTLEGARFGSELDEEALVPVEVTFVSVHEVRELLQGIARGSDASRVFVPVETEGGHASLEQEIAEVPRREIFELGHGWAPRSRGGRSSLPPEKSRHKSRKG